MFGNIVPAPPPEEEAGGEDGGEDENAAHWPSFRGPGASGVGNGPPVPERWNVARGVNVLWKAPVAGLAHSSPVVWGDRVFVTTAVGDEEADLKIGLYGSIWAVPDEGVQRFQVLCLDRLTGEVLWERTAHEGEPLIKRHPKGSHAASTPATDGRHVVAMFGSEGLYGYDVEGELLWSKDLGRLDSGYYMAKGAQWGFGSSPVIHDGLVLLQCDVQGLSLIHI